MIYEWLFLFMIMIQVILCRESLDPKHRTLKDVSKGTWRLARCQPRQCKCQCRLCFLLNLCFDIFKDLKIINANRIKKRLLSKWFLVQFVYPPQALFCSHSQPKGCQPPQNRPQGQGLCRECSPTQWLKGCLVSRQFKSRDRLLHFKSSRFYISRLENQWLLKLSLAGSRILKKTGFFGLSTS